MTVTTKTTDLGHGWFANVHTSETEPMSMTIRNGDKGQRIELPAESVARLRQIFSKVH